MSSSIDMRGTRHLCSSMTVPHIIMGGALTIQYTTAGPQQTHSLLPPHLTDVPGTLECSFWYEISLSNTTEARQGGPQPACLIVLVPGHH